MKVLIDKKGNKYLWSSGDLHTLFGVIKEKEIKNKTGKIHSHINHEFLIFNASFPDKLKKFTRSAATTHLKDIAQIIVKTGINNKSKIVDAGTGTGFLAAHLANISSHITTYEKNKEFYKLAKKNFEKLKLKIKIKNKDISQGIKEKNLDLITLDLKEPWLILNHANKSLKSGAYLVTYLPNITQVTKLVKESSNFLHEKTIEILEREWIIENIRARPKNQMLGHTAFITFLRKI